MILQEPRDFLDRNGAELRQPLDPSKVRVSPPPLQNAVGVKTGRFGEPA
jgi:hypothetical protein